MKKKTTTTLPSPLRLLLGTAAAACVAAACTTASDPAGAIRPTMDIGISTRNAFGPPEGGGTSRQALIRIYGDDQLELINQGKAETVWHGTVELPAPSQPDRVPITNTVETGTYYPLGRTAYAMGYGPWDKLDAAREALEKEIDGSLPTYLHYLPGRDGTDSVFYTSNYIMGSYTSPFENPLEFRRGTVRLRFFLRRDPKSMKGMYVRYVRITVPGRYIPNVLRYDESERHYVCAVKQDLEPDILNPKPGVLTNAIAVPAEFTPLMIQDHLYLAPAKSKSETEAFKLEGLKVEAFYYPEGSTTADEEQYNKTWENRTVELKALEGEKTIYGIEGGQSYDVTLTFGRNNFTLEAVPADWEENGSIPIPVPDPGNGTATTETPTSEP